MSTNAISEYSRRAAKALSELDRLGLKVTDATRNRLAGLKNGVSEQDKRAVRDQERRVMKAGGAVNRVNRAKKPKSPKRPKSPKSPKRPKSPKAPKRPKSPKSPKSPKRPKSPVAALNLLRRQYGSPASSTPALTLLQQYGSPVPMSPGPMSPGPMSPGPMSPGPMSPGPMSPAPMSPGYTGKSGARYSILRALAGKQRGPAVNPGPSTPRAAPAAVKVNGMVRPANLTTRQKVAFNVAKAQLEEARRRGGPESASLVANARKTLKSVGLSGLADKVAPKPRSIRPAKPQKTKYQSPVASQARRSPARSPAATASNPRVQLRLEEARDLYRKQKVLSWPSGLELRNQALKYAATFRPKKKPTKKQKAGGNALTVDDDYEKIVALASKPYDPKRLTEDEIELYEAVISGALKQTEKFTLLKQLKRQAMMLASDMPGTYEAIGAQLVQEIEKAHPAGQASLKTELLGFTQKWPSASIYRLDNSAEHQRMFSSNWGGAGAFSSVLKGFGSRTKF